MNASLVERPRLAIATAVAIIVAVAIVAALFPKTISSAEIPERGNSLEDLYGRTFVAVDATEGGEPHQLPGEPPMTVTFHLDGRVVFWTPCGELFASDRLVEDLFGGRNGSPTLLYEECSGQRLVQTDWLEAFLAERPAWRLDGDTLVLSSDFGTMTTVDEGTENRPSEIRGKRFYAARLGESEPRFGANTWLSLSFDRDGTMHAQLGCECVVAPTEVRSGWFRITEALRHERTNDCSRSMAAQETAWLWDLLDQPVRWEVTDGQHLTLKAYRSEEEPLWLSRVFDGKQRRTDPNLLVGKRFYAAPVSALSRNLDGYRPIVIEVGENGEFTATAGCEQPSVHGRFRTGWVQFGQNLEWSLSACEDVEAERWLGDFLAHEPTWYIGRLQLVLQGGRRSLSFAEADNYRESFSYLPPSDVGGN